MSVDGILLASWCHVPIDVLIGRSAAFCVYPHLAWPRLSVTGRVLLIAAYGGGAYSLVLATLFVL